MESKNRKYYENPEMDALKMKAVDNLCQPMSENVSRGCRECYYCRLVDGQVDCTNYPGDDSDRWISAERAEVGCDEFTTEAPMPDNISVGKAVEAYCKTECEGKTPGTQCEYFIKCGDAQRFHAALKS